MRHIALISALLILGVTRNLSAQSATAPVTDPFVIPTGAVRDSFFIQLDGGNSLVVRLSNLASMPMTFRIDSLMDAFDAVMRPFRDSLSDPLSVKHLILVTDEQEKHFLRIRQSPLPASDYLVTAEGVSAPMKVSQDTVTFLRLLEPRKTDVEKGGPSRSCVALTFYVNDYRMVDRYRHGSLPHTLEQIYAAAKKQTHWSETNNRNLRLSGGYALKDADAGIAPKIHARYRKNDALSPMADISLQNVYDHLSPSIALGITLQFPKGDLVHQLKLGWEPMFLFSGNGPGPLKTYRNDWLFAEYGIFPVTHSAKVYAFTGNLSFSYLLRQSGDYFHENTFRLGIGGFRHDKLSLTPVIYFHDLFKGVSPALRLSVTF